VGLVHGLLNYSSCHAASVLFSPSMSPSLERCLSSLIRVVVVLVVVDQVFYFLTYENSIDLERVEDVAQRAGA
jgi:hypothetical protein